MSFSVTLVPGKVWQAGESITIDKLNETANPTIELAGTVGTASLSDNSVSTPKLQAGVLSADATGRSKMADEFLIASKLGPDVAGDGLTGGAGLPLAVNPDGITIEISGDKVRVKSTGAGVVSASRNLVAQPNSASANSKVDVVADEVLLKDSSGNAYLASSVSVTVDITASGANGLDTGTEAISTWYYVWLIYNSTSNTKAGLLSVSSSAPTMPAGYTYKALVGAVRNDASSNFVSFYQQGRIVFVENPVVFTGLSGATSWTALSGTPLTTFQGIVPPLAKAVRGNAGATGGSARGIAVAADANALGVSIIAGQPDNAVLSFQLAGVFYVPLKTSQLFYYRMTDTSSTYRLTVSSYEL